MQPPSSLSFLGAARPGTARVGAGGCRKLGALGRLVTGSLVFFTKDTRTYMVMPLYAEAFTVVQRRGFACLRPGSPLPVCACAT